MDFPGLIVEEHEHTKFSKEDSHFVEIYEKEYDSSIDKCDPFDVNTHYSNMMEKNEFRIPQKLGLNERSCERCLRTCRSN